jgi:hypothetical protein
MMNQLCPRVVPVFYPPGFKMPRIALEYAYEATRRQTTATVTEEDDMRTSPRAVLSAVLISALTALPSYAQKSPPAGNKEAMAVVDKMIAAQGGRKLLESIKDMTISGETELNVAGMTMTAPITVYQKYPDKVRVDISLPDYNMNISQAFDGQKGRYTNPQAAGAIEEMPGHMTKQLARQAGQNEALLRPEKHGVTYLLKPKATLDGKDYIVLEQALVDGHKTTFYLDPQTYLPYRTVSRALDMSGTEVEAETYSTDYRKIAGTTVPYAIRVVQNGADVQRLTVTSVRYNTNLEDGLFILK